MGCVSFTPFNSLSESFVSREMAAFSLSPIDSGSGTSGMASMAARHAGRDTSVGIL
jgi:hypothetical protein